MRKYELGQRFIEESNDGIRLVEWEIQRVGQVKAEYRLVCSEDSDHEKSYGIRGSTITPKEEDIDNWIDSKVWQLIHTPTHLDEELFIV